MNIVQEIYKPIFHRIRNQMYCKQLTIKNMNSMTIIKMIRKSAISLQLIIELNLLLKQLDDKPLPQLITTKTVKQHFSTIQTLSKALKYS